ncbi:MAG: ABC transporter permease [Oscillospiraceae bacterium]|mgnify:CR=1 FL=1|nr:ABC transporter permease [Oscillospiraceae bacterium]
MKKKNILKSNALQSLLSSLICVILGMLIGYIVLLFINPDGAWKAITDVIKNFFFWPAGPMRAKYFGTTLVKAAPLAMCSMSILFAYKVGLFNIGVAGQYVAGAGAAIYGALAWNCGWLTCLILAIAAGAVFGAISGALKAYCNVNEVISGIMLNWIGLYSVNMLLTKVKEPSSPYTNNITSFNTKAILPNMGLDKLFGDNQYVTIAIPLAIIFAVAISIILNKTRFGYELKATGNNKNAAKYCGMKEKRNIIITLVIGGGLAGMGAGLLYLTGIEQWSCSQSSVPSMGFNGIAAAFLGCLDPLGSLLSSFFIQHITNGGGYVDKTMYCSQISDLISSIIIYLCGFVMFFKVFMNSRIAKSEERKAAKAKAAENALPVSENTDGGDKK